MSLGRQTVFVYLLRQGLQRHFRLEAPHKNTYRSSSLQMQFVRKILHTAVLSGIALPQSPRCSASIRIQGATNKGKSFFFYLHQKQVFHCFLSPQMYVCEECGHTTNEPEVHYIHLKDKHPYSPALLKFYDKRHFKFTNSQFANNLLGSFPMPVHN